MCRPGLVGRSNAVAARAPLGVYRDIEWSLKCLWNPHSLSDLGTRTKPMVLLVRDLFRIRRFCYRISFNKDPKLGKTREGAKVKQEYNYHYHRYQNGDSRGPHRHQPAKRMLFYMYTSLTDRCCGVWGRHCCVIVNLVASSIARSVHSKWELLWIRPKLLWINYSEQKFCIALNKVVTKSRGFYSEQLRVIQRTCRIQSIIQSIFLFRAPLF